MAFLGLPAVVMSIADNQIQVAQSLQSAEVAHNLGCVEGVVVGDIAASIRRLLDDCEERERQSENGKRLVGGKGFKRIERACLQGGVFLANRHSSYQANCTER